MADRVRGAGPGNASTMRAFSARTGPIPFHAWFSKISLNSQGTAAADTQWRTRNRIRLEPVFTEGRPTLDCEILMLFRSNTKYHCVYICYYTHGYEISLRIHLLLYTKYHYVYIYYYKHWIRNMYTFIIIRMFIFGKWIVSGVYYCGTEDINVSIIYIWSKWTFVKIFKEKNYPRDIFT